MPLKPEIKTRWLAALRSGQYQQSRSRLRNTKAVSPLVPEGYCCLGVLCDVVKDEVGGRWGEDDNIFYVKNPKGVDDLASQTLPFTVQKHCGLNSDDPVVKGVFLSAWNDGRHGNNNGAPFPEIADLIEQYL